MITLLASACASTPATLNSAASASASAGAQADGSASTAGSSSAQSSTAPAAAGGTKTMIAMWANPPETGTINCFAETVVKPFNAQSATTQVDFVEQANAWDATRTAISGGAGPDIVTTPGPSFAYELAKAGQLLPLDEYVHQFNWSQTFLPWP